MDTTADAASCRRELLRHAPALRPHAVDVLTRLYTEPRQPVTTGSEPVAIEREVRISIAEGAGLYDLVRRHRVSSAIEIGFAYGFSTLWLLEGLARVPGARHLAIDPFETQRWQGVGVRQVEALASEVAFELVERSSLLVLPELVAAGRAADFVFIDSRHVFDETLVEFVYADLLLPVGGILAFDDMWMPAMRAVREFVLRNRSYEQVPQPVRNLCVLRKTGGDERDWNHFVPFPTGGFAPLRWAKALRGRLG
jgi:predicted O-methyltransferase YrrM